MTRIFLSSGHFFLVTKRTRTLVDDKKDKFYETLLGSIWSCLLLFYSSKAYHRTFSPAVSKLWGKTSKASPQEINILFSYSLNTFFSFETKNFNLIVSSRIRYILIKNLINQKACSIITWWLGIFFSLLFMNKLHRKDVIMHLANLIKTNSSELRLICSLYCQIDILVVGN